MLLCVRSTSKRVENRTKHRARCRADGIQLNGCTNTMVRVGLLRICRRRCCFQPLVLFMLQYLCYWYIFFFFFNYKCLFVYLCGSKCNGHSRAKIIFDLNPHWMVCAQCEPQTDWNQFQLYGNINILLSKSITMNYSPPTTNIPLNMLRTNYIHVLTFQWPQLQCVPLATDDATLYQYWSRGWKIGSRFAMTHWAVNKNVIWIQACIQSANYSQM